MTVKVQRWGNSLGVRIPRGIVTRSKIHEGAELEVSYSRGKVILRPVKVPSLKELLAQVDPANRPDLADWGRPVGREVW